MNELTTERFPFRPWVRRAGWSIVLVTALATLAIVIMLIISPTARFGWIGERFVWVYIGTLWIGGLKVLLGTRNPVAELGEEGIVLRPVHQIGVRRIAWDRLRGTEQTIGGDRLILYYDTLRGMRFVALNLNLVKGRREFLRQVEQRLQARGFVENIVERSRYLSRQA